MYNKDVNDSDIKSDDKKAKFKFTGKKGPKSKRKGKPRNGGTMRYTNGKQFNDISFYTRNKSISDTFGKLPFSFILGNLLPGGSNVKWEMAAVISFVLDYVVNDQCINKYTDEATPSILDQLTTIIYTAMRRANAGATNNIEPLDVIISNLLASIDIFANAVYINRIFKIANRFSWKNRTIPRVLFQHMNIDYDDFIANQANYKGMYNTLVAQAKTIRTLSNFPFVNAYFAEFQNIFKDEDTDTGREQLILPVKGFHHIYDPIGTTDLPGGMVRLMTAKDLGSTDSGADKTPIYTGKYASASSSATTMKFQVLLQIMQKQIDVLVNDNDFNLIQADIEKAFGEQSGYIEVDIANDTPQDPIYSEEFLTMFHNGVFFQNPMTQPYNPTGGVPPRPLSNGVGVLKPNAYVNCIYQLPSSDASRRKIGYNHTIVYDSQPTLAYLTNDTMTPALSLIDTNINDPTPEDIIIQTRYKTFVKEYAADSADIPADFRPVSPGTNTKIYGVSCGSNFICFGGYVTLLTSDSATNQVTVDSVVWDNVRGNATLAAVGFYNVNHYPLDIYYNSSSNKYSLRFQLNNLRLCTGSELRNINVACFLSLWAIPERMGL